MSDGLIPTYKEFSHGMDLLGSLDSIRSFNLSVGLPKAARLDAKKHKLDWMSARLYRDLAEVLETSGLQGVENLSVTSGDDSITATYSDPSFGFTVNIDVDLEVRIVRTGSSFKLFHAWYRRFVPYFHGLISRMALDLSLMLGLPFDLMPSKIGFRFGFLLYDFMSTHQTSVKNLEVVQPLIRNRPGRDGKLIDIKTVTEEGLDSGRIDVTLSHFRPMPEVEDDFVVREVYDVEAPANHNYRGLWLGFAISVETPTGIGPENADSAEISLPKPELLLEHYHVPYMTFFRDRVARGFLADLLKTWQFKSTADQMS